MRNLIAVITCLLLVVSCNYKMTYPPAPNPGGDNNGGNNGDDNSDDNNGGDDGSGSSGGDGGSNDKLLYAQSVEPILQARCTVCHGSFGGVNLESFEQTLPTLIIGDSAHSPLCTVLLDGRMPPGNPLSQEDTETICQWIDDGALQ